LKSDQVQEEQTAKSNIEKELNEFRLNVDENKRSTDSDLEKLKIEHEEEVELLNQEVTSLQFQLSAEQIKYEQAIQVHLIFCPQWPEAM
jgi:Cu/Ag efflux pump CusA